MSYINLKEYYESLSKEIFSKYNRVRNLVNHYGEDGKYKEIIIKKMIANFLPEDYGIGTGFVATRGIDRQNEHTISSQIDLIIYKKSYPILFKEDDFVIVIPDAVRGIIEVKSNLKNQKNAIQKASHLGQDIRQKSRARKEIFNGILSFDGHKRITVNNKNKINQVIGTVNHIVLNHKYFVKNFSDDNSSDIRYYNLPDLTIAYFIQNLISYITAFDNNEQRQEQALRYPIDKELNRIQF